MGEFSEGVLVGTEIVYWGVENNGNRVKKKKNLYSLQL